MGQNIRTISCEYSCVNPDPHIPGQSALLGTRYLFNALKDPRHSERILPKSVNKDSNRIPTIIVALDSEGNELVYWRGLRLGLGL